MSDTVGTPGDDIQPVTSSAVSSVVRGGLIDVSGMTIDELSAAIGTDDLGWALDYILASRHNGSAYHGFNSSI